MSNAKKGDSLHPRSAPTSRLGLVANNDTVSTASTSRPPRAQPALAVWPLECAAAEPLPRELARQLITHYSDAGELVIAASSARETVPAARELGRRALPLTTRKGASGAVTGLRANERATLATACVEAGASARTITTLARRVCERLAASAFFVLALDGAHGPLGPIVRACEQQRLQYWQHVIAIDPQLLSSDHECDDAAVRSLRVHRDLLVFRSPAQADTIGREAARAAVAA